MLYGIWVVYVKTSYLSKWKEDKKEIEVKEYVFVWSSVSVEIKIAIISIQKVGCLG